MHGRSRSGWLVAARRRPRRWPGRSTRRGYAKAVTCSACHGANGNSRSESMPILAGIDAAYFKKTIEDYAAGRRAVARDGAVRQAGEAPGRGRDRGVLRRPEARALAGQAGPRRGRAGPRRPRRVRGVPRSRGPGRCAPSSFRPIAGQPAGYLRNQLLLFKADKRSPGDPALIQLKSAAEGDSRRDAGGPRGVLLEPEVAAPWIRSGLGRDRYLSVRAGAPELRRRLRRRHGRRGRRHRDDPAAALRAAAGGRRASST